MPFFVVVCPLPVLEAEKERRRVFPRPPLLIVSLSSGGLGGGEEEDVLLRLVEVRYCSWGWVYCFKCGCTYREPITL